MAFCILVLSVMLFTMSSAHSVVNHKTTSKAEIMNEVNSKTILDMLMKIMNKEYANKDVAESENSGIVLTD